MTRRQFLLLALASMIGTALAGGSAAWAADETGQHAHVFEMKKADNAPANAPTEIGYWLHIPAGWKKDADKKWPVVLFLHGAGESGDGRNDIAKVKMHGPPKLAEKDKDFPYIVISPQCTGRGWGRYNAMLKALVEETVTKYNGDPDRVYLTGLSMGGFGTWSLAAAYPDMWAAAVPICGGGNPNAAEKIKNLPIWVFHGEKDQTVKIATSEAMVEALKKAGAAEVKFTRYPEAGHDSWTATYKDAKMWEWLLSHQRGKPAKPAANAKGSEK